MSADALPARCSERADARHDSMLGSAFPAARLLLVEQPGPWGHDGLRESRFDAAVARELVARAGRAGVRVQAIRRPGRVTAAPQRAWAFADCRVGRESMRWGSFDADDELLTTDFTVAGAPSSEPAVLVCANGKHDACCAIRGRPVALALAAAAPELVWECTHLGGDRFPANVLVLPGGLLYGRVTVADAERVLAAARADEVLPEALRGRVGLAPVAQAALAFGYAQLGIRARSALRVDGVQQLPDGNGRVRLLAGADAYDVHVALTSESVQGLTCARLGPGTYLRCIPTSITPA